MADFIELNNDQRREIINTRQRFAAWQDAARATARYRGSMVWSPSKGTDYLLKSYYDERGNRRQQSLGRRGPETEELKRRFDEERASTVTARCLIPGFDGASLSSESKEALWARFSMGAPRRQRRSVERYSIVKRA